MEVFRKIKSFLEIYGTFFTICSIIIIVDWKGWGKPRKVEGDLNFLKNFE